MNLEVQRSLDNILLSCFVIEIARIRKKINANYAE